MNFFQVLNFWFQEVDPRSWFANDEGFDQHLRTRFSVLVEEALLGNTSSWRQSPEGSLAEILVLDQFPRNMFRNTPKAFAGDSQALHLAQEAVRRGDDLTLPLIQRHFMYMPYMHSEDPEVHKEALRLFSQKGLEDGLKYEILHKDIIDRFGRYPHRNAILGRESTPEEREFLKQPGMGF